MKISLITVHGYRNYGSVLQTYATQEKFKEYGAETEVVNYVREDSNDKNFTKWLIERTLGNSKNLAKKLVYTAIISKSIKKFAKICDSFLKEKVQLSRELCYHFNDIINNIKESDIYCTGSDQVWNVNANNGILPAYYLEFAPKNKRCISYASSFGTSQFTSKQLEEMKPYFKKYKYLSLREHYGIKLLNEMGYEADFVLDPTMVVDKNFWSKLFETNPVKGKYILIYQLNTNKRMDEYAKNVQRITGLPIIRIGTRYDHVLRCGKTLCFPSVGEWLTLFNDAEYVLTDSFHGTAFSINFNKQFLCFSPKNFSDRLIDILENFSLTDQMISDYNDFEKIKNKINYKNVNEKLDLYRKSTDQYLRKAFSD